MSRRKSIYVLSWLDAWTWQGARTMHLSVGYAITVWLDGVLYQRQPWRTF